MAVPILRRVNRIVSTRMKLFFVVALSIGAFVTTVLSRNIEAIKGNGNFQGSNGVQEETLDLNTIRLVQVMFRHGDRTPIDRFPKDPYDSRKFWPEGRGKLTKIGKMMHYQLGQYLRNRYDGFIAAQYVPEEIYVRSSDYDRTIQSAMANLYGMWPPTPEDLRFDSKVQQYVPVHSISPSEDNKLAMSKDCPKYTKLFKDVLNVPSEIQFNNEHKDLYTYLSEHTGLDIQNYFNASDINDILFCQKSHNLSAPEWTNQVFPDKLRAAAEKAMKSYTLTKEMLILRAAPLITDLVRNMKRSSEKPSEKELDILEALFHSPAAKFYMYSGHDSTLSAILDALDLYDEKIPPYASSLYFELHEINGDHIVKIFYKPIYDAPSQQLKLHACDFNCKLEDFMKIMKDYILDETQWAFACQL